MTHQEGIARCLSSILSLDAETLAIFRRGNPFDKLLRSFDEFNSEGKGLYKNQRARNHYKMSVAAFAAYESGVKINDLYAEHCVPVALTIQKLLTAPQKDTASILAILQENEVVVITREEQIRIDAAVHRGGLGLRNRMPEGGVGCSRLDAAGIKIAPETLGNTLLVK